MPTVTRLVRQRGGVPIFDYRTDPGTPPVSILRLPAADQLTVDRPHIHDFPVLLYIRDPGAVYVVAAGVVIDPVDRDAMDNGVVMFFDPALLGAGGRGPAALWHEHPLLLPFLHGNSGGVLRLEVPPARTMFWDATIEAMEAELATRGPGYRQAVSAHLTLLLIELARLAVDVVGDLRRSGEPLLAEVFEVIARRYGEQLSLRDVARAVGMTPGHLTTVVRRRTGRTVQEWIIERRMAEARRLLTETELPIGEIAHRVGIFDPGYFTRLFRRTHGSTPRRWRSSAGQA
ncbi:helix-turn-helix transcriptional regulator [Nocardia sp. NPDC052566]|uniref:helix-turn-helix transcriptional regulator n=1 Tax=Nocardia sp. NPDC052566 TaxID=3364330 RepID=UPI0037C8F488